MAVYAIGDIQGCYDDLCRLLEEIRFDPAGDQLWFAGDLVNRGPQSLATLRLVKGLGEAARTVLGNHDLHLLATSRGNHRHVKKGRLDEVLTAPDRDELLDWLRRRPLLHRDPQRSYTMVHAGLAPQWDIATAEACARELESTLQGPDFGAYCQALYGNQPDRWSPDLRGMERLRFITNCFTRMRFVHTDGRLDLNAKGPPGSQPAGLLPWYALPDRASRGERIIFGHWSTLGLYAGDNVWGIDTGCLWGGGLTALKLRRNGSPKAITHRCAGFRRPKPQLGEQPAV